MTLDYLRLGAPLYVPATRPDLAAIAHGERFGALRSMIFCTEDAVAARQLDAALENLRRLLSELRPSPMLRFIRARDGAVLARLLEMPGIDRIDGFVLPKVTRRGLPRYLELLADNARHWIMPTLETVETFDPREMRQLRNLLERSPARPRVLAIRIGGNDLLNLLATRRGLGRTIYETPLGGVLAMLTMVFKPAGFALAAPVHEGLNQPRTLAAEVARDLDFGLFAKAAIHPDQVRWIEAYYAVTPTEWELARAILRDEAPAVFRLHDVMCEPATHAHWAAIVLERQRLFGVRGPVEPEGEVPSNQYLVNH